ncbi:glycosyltransferase [Candidatus Uhrbacteria bacterium]|nr:glycosyltransferase [Candidatus Uhrbacteria bacterium]
MKPDLVISHNMRGMGMSVARGLKTSGVFWMHTLHDVQLLVPSGLRWVRAAPTFLTRMWQSAFVTWPYSRWTKWLVGSPHVIVGPSTFVVHAHATMGLFEHSRRLVLENPLDLKLSVRPRDLRHNPFRLLYIGQLELHKGVFILLAALMHIHESLELTIAGAGSLEDKLVEQSLALPTCVSIVWKGSVSREEVGALLQRSDALVFPSLVAENCPGVLLEARAVGLPIIASNVGGVSEFVHESGLVPPGTPRALAQKIHEAMNGRVECLHRPVQSVGEYVLGILEEVTSEK